MFRRWLTGSLARRIARSVPASWRRRAVDPAVELLVREAQERLDAAVRLHEREWRAVDGREDWERFRDARVAALRSSLRLDAVRPQSSRSSVVAGRSESGCVIENLVYESRPGFPVSANLYRPPDGGDSAGPGLVVCHSHHCDKSQVELQEIGRAWAERGCVVLIPDLPGHGERRRHPFRTPEDYRLPYPARQDYFFRFNLGMQLQLVGDGLMAWMVEDLMRGIDLLSDRADVDPRRIALIGAVAGGGDVAAATAALDTRVTCLVAFGIESSTVASDTGGDPIPGASSPGWEPTRCLRLSARDGFLPWLLLAACAPRRVVYAHEFDWRAETDPVWKRLQEVFALYDVRDRLAAMQGRGSVRGSPPQNTHCTNVGRFHRQRLDPILAEWLNVRMVSERVAEPLPARELVCFRGVRASAPPPIPIVAKPASPGELRAKLKSLFGDHVPAPADPVGSAPLRGRRSGEDLTLTTEGDVRLRLRLLFPGRRVAGPLPAVLGVCQHGGVALLRRRSKLVRALLDAGLAVGLADVRGVGPRTGEWQRGRHGPIQRVVAAEQMLGRSLLAARLGDLRSIVGYLARRPEIDAERLGLWGDSLAATNPADFDPRVPYDAGPFPAIGEPLGGLLAILGAVFDAGVGAVFARGAPSDFTSLAEGVFSYLPYDTIVPGLLEVADVDDLVALLAPRPVRISAPVDALNRTLGRTDVDGRFERARESYRDRNVPGALALIAEPEREEGTARWLVDRLAGSS